MYKKRTIEAVLQKLSKTFPVIVLTGPRQVGKTTVFEHLRKKQRRSVSFDDLEMRAFAKRDPALFLEQFPPPIMIDEIQYAPEILSYIKLRVDKKHQNGMYWLMGSEHFYLMRGVSESLAGRAAIVKLLGFSQAEVCGNKFLPTPWIPNDTDTKKIYTTPSLTTLFERILHGNFPKQFDSNAPSRETFYASYMQTVVERDFQRFLKNDSILTFEKFIRLCAARTAQQLNLSDLARDAGITHRTTEAWLNLLEASGHIFLLRPYYRNISKRLVKTAKLYFLDTGLACYLTGWRSPTVASLGAMAGALFETFIVAELLKNFWNRGEEAPLWYYRTKEKYEVDILIERDGKLYPIEIKLAIRITEQDIRGIENLRKTGVTLGPAVFISLTPQPYLLSKDVRILPYTVIEHF